MSKYVQQWKDLGGVVFSAINVDAADWDVSSPSQSADLDEGDES